MNDEHKFLVEEIKKNVSLSPSRSAFDTIFQNNEKKVQTFLEFAVRRKFWIGLSGFY